MIEGNHPGFLAILELIQACDYRILPVGLERGDGCGCNPEVVCLLRRGSLKSYPHQPHWSDCVECVTTPAGS